MVKCVFCGREESSYIGVHLINNDGSISYFCSSKCRKNALKLRRDKRKLKWTEAYRLAKTKAENAVVRKVEAAEADEKRAADLKAESPKQKKESKTKRLFLIS